MKSIHHRRSGLTTICLTLLWIFTLGLAQALSPNPDLTAAGAIATLKTDTNSSPLYGDTYNLGATGLRGWIYIGGGNGADGTITVSSRQILIAVASAPGNAALAVDDVILGAMAGSSGTVPLFTSDARKALGVAIGDAEKPGAGTLRVKRWRAGVTTDENIAMTIMGDYTATAPYTCPKSELILANARNKLISLPDATILTNSWSGAINGLALLAGVPESDYATVQTRLQTYARAMATAGPKDNGLPIWDWAYMGLFLAEYYLATGDANVLPGINSYTLKLAQSQTLNGTFGHGASVLRPDGSGRRMGIGYGPVNAVGIVANMALVLGKKALLQGGQAIDPEISGAIQRGSDFFAFYVNKGPIPYGEHEPFISGHSSNGKDPMCAVFFGLQTGRAAETEYYSRMTTASFNGREYGHTGQGFSYLWSAMGANMGGSLAVAEHLKPVRWHLDLSRRTDGSFAYDGAEQYGGGKTSDGTYLGASGYHGMNATASYILTFALPLQRLYITGKSANPANTLDSTKVAHAIAAASFKVDSAGFTNAQLMTSLSDFDPVVRHYAAIELGKMTRTLTPQELADLRLMITGGNANGRMGACQALGLRQDATALPLITGRLDKAVETDLWVRAKAATAIRSYTAATASAQLTPMLTAFTANATDPEVINWSDPVQISNRYLSLALFGNGVGDGSPGNNVAAYTINASKSLLYPAVKAGLKQPDSYPRAGAAKFCVDLLPLTDVQALILDFFDVIEIECLADRMWSASPRASGIKTMSKHKVSDGIPLALAMLEIPKGFEWGSDDVLIAGLNALVAYGDAARYTLPTLRSYLGKWSATSTQYTTLVNTIASIEAAITAPAQVPGLAVANSQIVATTGPKAITLTGSSPRTTVTFINVTAPSHGTLTGTAPNLTYTPPPGYSGPDRFTFQTTDGLTTSNPGAVGIIVGTAGAGLKAEYFDNMDFTNLKLTRTDAEVNFDWATASPNAALSADTFSVRWDGLLLVPETGVYTFSTLNSDGVRLYVNGALIIDDYVDQTTNWKDSASLNLTAGQVVDLHMQYYENTGSAVAKLKWTGPSFAGANGAIIAREWLYDGTGMPRTAYAHSQSVTLVKNTPQPITLSGSGGTLTYSVVTPPTSGTLTGTAPNLIYTPTANYSGSDSFTFLVNNGTGNSAPATVSIGILAGQPVDFFWAAAASGNWSGATSWNNAAGATVVPDADGQAFYRMSISKSGTYTVTQDLSGGFLLNQLNMAGVVTLAGTNSLTFAANGTQLPQFNQNSSSAVTVGIPMSLAAMTTFAGNSGGLVAVTGQITGTGGLTKSGAGELNLYSTTANNYSGGTIVNDGTLHLGAIIGGISPLFTNPMGSGPVTLNNGTIDLERVNASNPLTLNGGTLFSSNGWGATWSGPIILNANATLDSTWNLTCSGVISGAGGFTKTGGKPLIFSGTNNSTGANRVSVGTLTCSNSAALGTGSLDITTGANVALNYTGTRTIAALTFNAGAPVAPGTYGSTASPAANKNDTYFSGTGTVTILPSTTTALALTSGTTPTSPGAPLTFTATVTGSTPSGNVSFYDGATLLETSALNGSFQASFTTSSLASGSRSITAQYAGNTTNGTSTSNAVPVEVISLLPPAPANLVAAPGSNHIGLTWTISVGADSYYVKRSLTAGGTYSVIGNPTGASYDDLTAVNGTTYYYRVSALNTAGESANSNLVSGTPALVPTTTTLVSSPDGTSPYGTAVTFTATVSGAGGPATGTVTFRDGSTVLGTGALSAGTAVFATSTLAVANHSITATYSGDTTFVSSVTAPSAYLVTPKILTLTGVTASNKVYDGNANATLASGTLSGVLGGETVTLIPGSGTFASANAGTWAVTATGFALGGAHAGNYALAAQPTVPNATITPRPVQLIGTRLYDGTLAAGPLSISNNLDGGNLTLTGSANLAGKNVGAQAVIMNIAAAVRVRSATGNTGTGANTSFTVTMGVAPVAGNTMVAVISTRGNADSKVSGITQTGAIWSRAAQAANTNGTTTEIWYAPSVAADAGTAVTIAQASLRSAAVVMEYSGVLAVSPSDQSNNATGSSISPVTGTTPTTTQANELWVGGIGFISSAPTLGSILNTFTSVANAQSTNSTAGNNAKVYALERIVSATGAASSGGTLSPSAQWSGAIATFKAVTPTTLALTGSAAANYTLTGATGTVQITPKALTVSGLAASGRDYDGTSVATLTGTAALPSTEAPGTGTTSDGKPYTGDAVALSGTAAATFADPNVGTAKAVTVTGLTLAGADSGNYTLTPPAGLMANITARPLTVTADNQNKVYGQTLSFGSGSTQFTSTGLQNGETIGSVTLTCGGGGAAAGVAGSPYPITPGAATGGTFTAGNYAIDYAAGALTVSPAGQAITFGTLAVTTYGNAPFALAATADSGLAVTYMSSNPAVASLSGNIVTIWTAGSATITASQAGDANYSAAISVPQTLTVNPAQTNYATWAAAPAHGLAAGVNDGPLDDPDHDGITNLLEFALGGEPMVSSQAIQPKLTHAGGGWVFSYDRSGPSKSSTTQVVEYGSDLTGWTPLTIPADSAGDVTITPGSSSDHVEVTLPTPGTHGFVRLKVAQSIP